MSDNADPKLEIGLTIGIGVVILAAIIWWTAVSLEAGRPGDLWMPWAVAIVMLVNCALGIQQARRALDYDRRTSEEDGPAAR